MRRRTKILPAIVLGLVLILGTAVACYDSSADIFFPVQESSDFDQMTADLRGELELDDGYLRLQYFADSYLLIWPYGFSVETADGEIQVLDGDGEVVEWVGDQIHVGGGETTLGIVEKYIGYSLPEGCEGPYWIVSEVIDD